MAKNADVGLKQLSNGNWAYRVTYTRDGKKTDTTIQLDSNGQPFKRKIDAKRAREQKLIELREAEVVSFNAADCRLQEIWDAYLKKSASGKAPATIKKYSSLWDQHVKKEFGNRYISSITVSDINAYLQGLYDRAYSYEYVKSFRKFFYQLFRFAYAEERIDSDKYTRMFLDKVTSIKMPRKNQNDYEKGNEIETYNSYEISRFREIFEQGDCYTAFLLGYMCGLRVAETFGLRWGDYNWDTHQFTVCRQMTIENGKICLRPVKSLKSSRIIDVPDVLHEHLREKIRQQTKHRPPEYTSNATETVLDKTGRGVTELHGGDFVNRRVNGKLLTINSIKYCARKIKKETGIAFKYHALRRTHLTFLANQNIPVIEVMNRAGHKKFETTMKYYVGRTQESRQQLLNTINTITTEEQVYEVKNDVTGEIESLKESDLIRRQETSAVIVH